MSVDHRIFAPAKINLFLHVGGRGPDGYHALQSLVAFAGVGDWVEADPRMDAVTLEVTGPQRNAIGEDAENLVLRAAKVLRDYLPARSRTGIGAALRLEKILPVASGIGGGSSDAAAALLLLNQLWNLRLTPKDLEPIALNLGSDVPVCLRRRPQWMSGRGEQLADGPQLPPFWYVLVNPGMPVPTGEVFARLQARRGAEPVLAPKGFPDASALVDWLVGLNNDLEEPARAIAPQIGSVLNAIAQTHGCLLARMSGSGGTCFGLFAEAEAAQEAASLVERLEMGWWVRAAPQYNESGPDLKRPG